ncbi:beta-lactamase-like protein [Hyaloraphidium curvatum]|nr:beta-lactamase-like protein [Hyaloraphidium curvatum]
MPWSILSAYSLAGHSTSVLLSYSPSPGAQAPRRTVLLDCGPAGLDPRAAGKADAVLITHGHADHLAGVFAHARWREISGLKPAAYLVPREAADGLERARAEMAALGGEQLPMRIVGVAPGDVEDLGGGLEAEALPAAHRVPAVGYLIHRTRRQLKEHFLHASPEQKRAAAAAGQDLYSPVREAEVSYSGDTAAPPCPRLFSATELVLLECTYLSDPHAARKHAHLSLPDLVFALSAHDTNAPDAGKRGTVVLLHFSARHSANEIRAAVSEAAWPAGRTVCAAMAACGGFDRRRREREFFGGAGAGVEVVVRGDDAEVGAGAGDGDAYAGGG